MRNTKVKNSVQSVVCCLDLEGVLVPEIWINVAERTGIEELRLTTRDIPDYDALMRRRLAILKREGIRLKDIQSVIAKMQPLAGGKKFLDSLRASSQVLILSDTYYEFAMPLMKKLGYPTLWCNRLCEGSDGFIADYRLRQSEGKRSAVQSLRAIGFRVHAAGDSFNDIGMLKAADRGVLFNPPEKIAKRFSQFKKVTTYPELLKALLGE